MKQTQLRYDLRIYFLQRQNAFPLYLGEIGIGICPEQSLVDGEEINMTTIKI